MTCSYTVGLLLFSWEKQNELDYLRRTGKFRESGSSRKTSWLLSSLLLCCTFTLTWELKIFCNVLTQKLEAPGGQGPNFVPSGTPGQACLARLSKMKWGLLTWKYPMYCVPNHEPPLLHCHHPHKTAAVTVMQLWLPSYRDAKDLARTSLSPGGQQLLPWEFMAFRSSPLA